MGAVIVDQSSWGQLRVSGGDRLRFLQGMVSNDIAALAPGAFARAAVLNVKGRVLAVVDIVADGDDYVVLTEPVTATKLREILERHAIVDDVAFAAEARPCHRVWDTPAAVWTAPPLFAPPPSPADEAAVEIRRVEGGLPRYGIDVSEDHFPFEANLDAAISYTKGCYIGQEVVARVHARGHPNRRLVGLRLSGEGPVAPGTPVIAPERPQPGTVTSSVVSPDFGAIALAYLPRKMWEPGTAVRAGDRDAVVAPLPFS